MLVQLLSEYSLSYSNPSSVISTSSLFLLNTSSQVSSLWFSQEPQLQRSAHSIHFGYPNSRTYDSCKISTQLIHREPAFAGSIGSKGNHPWLSSHNPHTRTVWQDKESVIFLFLLSLNLLISNDTTDRRPSEVIVAVRVISFLNRISYNELRSCWNFEIIYKVYTRIAQRVEIVWSPISLKVLMWSSDRIWCSTL